MTGTVSDFKDVFARFCVKQVQSQFPHGRLGMLRQQVVHARDLVVKRFRLFFRLQYTQYVRFVFVNVMHLINFVTRHDSTLVKQ